MSDTKFLVITGLSGSGKSLLHNSLEDLGYYCVDTEDSQPGAPVFNRTVPLRDSWAKIEARRGAEGGGAEVAS